jgi:hypothetical protein
MLSLRSVRDDDLLCQLSRLVSQSRGVEAEIVAHIAEVERRRLYAREACSSMFDYCRRVLGLREKRPISASPWRARPGEARACCKCSLRAGCISAESRGWRRI